MFIFQNTVIEHSYMRRGEAISNLTGNISPLNDTVYLAGEY